MKQDESKEILGVDNSLKISEDKYFEEDAAGVVIVDKESKKAEKKSRPKYIVIVILVFVFLLSAVATIFVIGKSKENSGNETINSGVDVTNDGFLNESGVVEIPMLKGKTIEEAQRILSENNINFKVFEENSDVAEKGIVIFQSVEEGSQITRNSLVYLTVSLGKSDEETTKKAGSDSGFNSKPVHNKPIETEIEVDSVGISLGVTSLLPGQKTKVNVEIFPKNATDKNYMLISDDNLVVSVEADDTIRAVAPGSANIEAYSTDGRILGSVFVTVKEPETKLNLTQKTITQAPVTQLRTTVASVVKYKIIFNANGGTVNEESRYVQKDSNYGTLPIPTRSGFSFEGWYTDSNEKVYDSTELVYNKNHTLTAHWIENEFSGWSDSLSSGVNSNSHEIKYRYRDKEFAASNSSSLDGWTPCEEQTVTYGEWKYGTWSKWGTKSISAKNTDTEVIEVESKTVYRYYYFACSNCGKRHCYHSISCWSGCGGKVSSKGNYYWSDIPYKNSKSSKETNDGSKRRTTSIKGNEIWFFSGGNINDTAVGTIDSHGEGNVVIAKGYRSRTNTRTKNVTYNFWKWGDWIYSDFAVTETDNRQVQYNYREK